MNVGFISLISFRGAGLPFSSPHLFLRDDGPRGPFILKLFMIRLSKEIKQTLLWNVDSFVFKSIMQPLKVANPLSPTR